MKILNYLLLFACAASFASCGDFLEERSQNQAYVEKASDLNELLIGECYLKGGYSLDSADANQYFYWSRPVSNMTYYFPYIHLMDDDIEEYVTGPLSQVMEKNYTRQKAQRIYTWQPDPFYDADMNKIEDENWRSFYKRIAVLNSILETADDVSGSPELIKQVEGEAHFLRAQFYFWLANLYGLPYSKTTAATDLCIPLKTTGEVEDRYFSRNTCQEVYGQIVSDLQQSISELDGIASTSKYKASEAAGFALLSRVCLYMEDYEGAVANADSVLKMGKYALLDLNTYTGGNSVYASSAETIFTQGANIMAVVHAPDVRYGINYISSGYSASDELMNLYDATDQRRKAFFIDRAKTHGTGFRCVKMRTKDEEISDIFALRLPEVYLNKAEALACLGRDAEARDVLHTLLSYRFPNGSVPTLTASGDELISLIRDERRKELCFEGQRWFDLRRYAVNERCPYTKSIRHTVLNDNAGSVSVGGIYELKPYNQDKAAYVLPIPYYAIDFNMGNLENWVRDDRQPINIP